MSYRDGIFVVKEMARRALRDKMRDAFFAEIGLPRLTDPFLLQADPASQHAKVLDLMKIARGKHQGDVSALDLLETSVSQLAVGMPVSPIGRPNQLTLEKASAEGMQRKNFDMTWAGWFDE